MRFASKVVTLACIGNVMHSINGEDMPPRTIKTSSFPGVAAFDISDTLQNMAEAYKMRIGAVQKPAEQPVELPDQQIVPFFDVHGALNATLGASSSAYSNDKFIQDVAGSGIPDPFTFEGISQYDQAAVNNLFVRLPSDSVGDVGPNHYVQMVNTAFAIYDKKGKLLMPIASLSSIWEGFEARNCATNNGDPIVLYDQFSDRWLLAHYGGGCFGTGSPCYSCLAVSTSGDPTGEYYRYAIPAQQDPFDAGGDTVFPDYPKWSIWSDSYIWTTRDSYPSSSQVLGVSVYAIDREGVLQGNPSPGVVQFTLLDSEYGNLIGDGLLMLPADIDGKNLPPPGAGAPIITTANGDDFPIGPVEFDALNVWELTVDWKVGTSELNFKTSLAVAPFNWLGVFSAPQPGIGVRLEALPFLNMFRLAYRNFCYYESILMLQTVDGNPEALGQRWYELRRRGDEYIIHQQSTFAPNDGISRWMGSMAQDRKGNIAIGYSVSDAVDVFPGIRYTARLATDPLNKMTLGEGIIAHGSGVQRDSSRRWGDYTSMNVDPTDDCTFWYTNQYYTSTGQFLGDITNIGGFYQTRIGKFKLPGCDKVTKKYSFYGKEEQFKAYFRRFHCHPTF